MKTDSFSESDREDTTASFIKSAPSILPNIAFKMEHKRDDIVIDIPFVPESMRGCRNASFHECPTLTHRKNKAHQDMSVAVGVDAERGASISLQKDEEELPRPLTELDHYIERRRTALKEKLPFGRKPVNSGNEAIIDDILGYYVGPANVIRIQEYEEPNATLDELRASYEVTCEAVVDFEQKISTLRANSKSESLTLAQKLVTGTSSSLFKCLRDFEPPPRPDLFLTPLAKERMQEQVALESNEPKAARNPLARRALQTTELAREWQREHDQLLMLEKARKLVTKENESLPSRLWIFVTTVLSPMTVLRLLLTLIIPDPELFTDMSPTSEKFLREFEKSAAPNLDWERHRLWAQSMDKKRKADWRLDWAWELDWNREWLHKERQEWKQSRNRWWKFTLEWPPWDRYRPQSSKVHEQRGDSEWMTRHRNEIEWLKRDGLLFPSQWNEREWLIQQIWWNDVEKWAGRWEERKRAVNEFSKTCLKLIKELGNMNGSTIARDFNLFRVSDSSRWLASLEHPSQLETHIADMKEAMLNGDKRQFMGNCDLIFKLIDGLLRSDGVERGLKSLIERQNAYRNSSMDFATVAIFFSSITASALQFSVASTDKTLFSTIVNACWFASLVFSISSATNSFLGTVVHQSTDFLRPSRSFFRRFLQKWFKVVPSFLLTFSGALFLAGLSAFTFSSTTLNLPKGKVIQLITLALTSSNLFAVIFMLLLTFTKVIHLSLKLALVVLLVAFGVVVVAADFSFIPILVGVLAAVGTVWAFVLVLSTLLWSLISSIRRFIQSLRARHKLSGGFGGGQLTKPEVLPEVRASTIRGTSSIHV